MDPQNWERLVRNWDDLTAIDLQDIELKDKLFAENFLSPQEYKDIHTMQELLRNLKQKQASRIYRIIIEALEKDHEHLAAKIKQTEVTTDPAIKAKGDPVLYEPIVREILLREFEQKKGKRTELNVIKNVLIEEKAFGNVTWSNKSLESFLPQVFNGINVTREPRKAVYVKNLCRVTQTGAMARDEETIQGLKTGGETNKNVTDMSSAELNEFLSPYLTNKDMPSSEILEAFKKHGITGEVFLSLTEKDFGDILPDSNFGTRCALLLLVENLSVASRTPAEREYLRGFDELVTHLTMYRQGFTCEPSTCAKGSTVSTVRMFCLPHVKDRNILAKTIGTEVIPFASACLNERRNGTAYFGINNNSGEIVGIQLDEQDSTQDDDDDDDCISNKVTKQVIQEELNYYLEKSFLAVHQEIMKCTIRDAKFIPVLSSSSQADEMPNLWVVEVDIKPSYKVVKNEAIITDLKFLPAYNKRGKTEECKFVLSTEGKPRRLSSNEQRLFKDGLHKRTAQRKKEERESLGLAKPNLRAQFLNLLTGGDEVIEDMMFYFLMLSPVSRTKSDADNMQFVLDLKPVIVFDFDANSSNHGLYSLFQHIETMSVLTTDDFDESKTTQEGIRRKKESLTNESRIPWMFCNGCSDLEIPTLQPVDWNKKRKASFQECLRFFITNFGKERVFVIMCLMSKTYETMIDASHEVLTQLSNNWMLLAETEDCQGVAKTNQRETVRW